MSTLRELRQQSDQLLYSGEFARALFGYVAVAKLNPFDLEVRLRIADTLLAMGRVQEAALGYTVVARAASQGGYPLLALVAILVLVTLEPQLAPLLDAFSGLYAQDSQRVGRGTRMGRGDDTLQIPDGLLIPADVDDAMLAKLAVELLRSGKPSIADKVPPIALLSQLPREAFLAVLSQVSLRRLRPGDLVFQEGEIGQSFFVIARGQIEVQRQDEGRLVTLATLGEGGIFGEMALLSETPRTASVLAASDVDLLEFDRNALLSLPEHLTVVSNTLSRFAVERVLTNLLFTSPLFLSLEPSLRRDLLDRFSQHEVAEQTDLIREGEEGRGLFILVAGKLDVWAKRGEQEELLAALHPGDIFGEMSLVFGEATNATVRAQTNSMVLFLDRDTFLRLLDRVPDVREYVLNLAEERRLNRELWTRTYRVDDWSENEFPLD